LIEASHRLVNPHPETTEMVIQVFGVYFQIEYKTGKENLATTSLLGSFMLAWSKPKSKFIKEVREAG